jgi:hypothetical protein
MSEKKHTQQDWGGEEIAFLNQDKLKSMDDKIKSGEIACNIDSPEDCESCSG